MLHPDHFRVSSNEKFVEPNIGTESIDAGGFLWTMLVELQFDPSILVMSFENCHSGLEDKSGRVDPSDSEFFFGR